MSNYGPESILQLWNLVYASLLPLPFLTLFSQIPPPGLLLYPLGIGSPFSKTMSLQGL